MPQDAPALDVAADDESRVAGQFARRAFTFRGTVCRGTGQLSCFGVR